MALYFDFNGILAIASVGAGLIWGIDRFLLSRLRVEGAPEPKLIEYAKAFFPVLLVVLLLRAVVAEPFRIPSGSMKPTLLEGEFILVNKYAYGVRLPIFGTKILGTAIPERGDIVVFRAPSKPEKMNMIKRVVGLPGDTLHYKDKVLYINGQPQQQQAIQRDFDIEPNGYVWRVKRSNEALEGHPHDIFIRPGLGFDFQETVVPEGHYFVMGDNRDNSEDSRSWGFLSDEYLIGKAVYVWMSWDGTVKDIRWNRIGYHISEG